MFYREEMMNGEPRTIKVLGNKETSYEIERYKDFFCYGRKNINEVCGVCKLRFPCFSTRDDIEVPVSEFHKESIKDVSVKIVANKFSGLKYKFKTDKVQTDRVQINFKKVVKKDV